MKSSDPKNSSDHNSSDDLSLSIIIPVHNEEDNVEILYKEIRSSVDPLNRPYEIIFIDDGSLHRPMSVLKEIKRKEKFEKNRNFELRIVSFSKNFGQTAAMQAGFDLAQGDVLVSLDGDLQNDPRDIPGLIAKLEEGYDLVCGWRKNRQDKVLTRKIPSKIANSLIRRLIGVSIHDLGCSLKAYRSELIKSVKLYSDMHRFIPVITAMKGAKITEIVVNHRIRKYGKAKYGLSRTWKVLLDLITLKMIVHFQHNPLRWFAFFGLFFGMIGFVLGAEAVFLYIIGVHSIVFPTACFLTIFLSGSLITWGLLAEYFISLEKK